MLIHHYIHYHIQFHNTCNYIFNSNSTDAEASQRQHSLQTKFSLNSIRQEVTLLVILTREEIFINHCRIRLPIILFSLKCNRLLFYLSTLTEELIRYEIFTFSNDLFRLAHRNYKFVRQI